MARGERWWPGSRRGCCAPRRSRPYQWSCSPGPSRLWPGARLRHPPGLRYLDDRVHPALLAVHRIGRVGDDPVGMGAVGLPPFALEVGVVGVGRHGRLVARGVAAVLPMPAVERDGDRAGHNRRRHAGGRLHLADLRANLDRISVLDAQLLRAQRINPGRIVVIDLGQPLAVLGTRMDMDVDLEGCQHQVALAHRLVIGDRHIGRQGRAVPSLP